MWMIGVTSEEQRGRMLSTYFLIAFIVLNYTAVHLLFNCIYSKHFWIDLEGLLCKYLDTNVYFSEKDVFFYFNKDYHKM